MTSSEAARVLFGPGSRHQIPAEIDRIGARQVLLVATRSATAAADELADRLPGRLAGRFDRPTVHTPVTVTDEAMALVRQTGADAVVAIGGGAAVGLSKALAARTGMPQVVVPTTYAGSEVTPVLGETENGIKTTRRDPALLPGTVIYDPELTVSMPAALTLTSALNALAHAVEALWAPDASAQADALAAESAAAIAAALPIALTAPADLEARERLLRAAWLAGRCLSQTQMGLHHQLAHALGGAFDLPHAELHALLLPHVMAFNLPCAAGAAAQLREALGGDPVSAVRHLGATVEVPRRLRDLGVPRDGLGAVAVRVAAAPNPNPRPVQTGPLTQLLLAAW